MAQHRVSPEAERDLDAIWVYVAVQSGNHEIADRLIGTITDRFSLLASQPHMGRRRDDDLRPRLRSFPAGDDHIIYDLEADAVRILPVWHGRRDIRGLLN